MKRETAPCSRGFDKSFVYLAGAGNHYAVEPQLDEGIPRLPSLCGDGLWMEDDKFIDRKRDLPSNFYSTKSFTDSMLDFLQHRTDEQRASPFFGYLAYTAPHWPLQAPKGAILKYKGFYDDGPDALRWQRLRSLQQLGIVSVDVKPAPVVGTSGKPWDKIPWLDKDWDQMNDKEKQKSSRLMEVFAAMVDQIDHHLGRVIEYLEHSGELDNTFVLFMSDNGAEGATLEAYPILNGRSLADVVATYYDNSLENLGAGNSFGWYGPRWACASTAPSRAFKMHSTEGGIRCPCIVRHPRTITRPLNFVSHAFTTVMDIMPTILDLANIKPPQGSFRGRPVVPLRGKSWVRYLSDSTMTQIYDGEFDFTGWELFGTRAVRQGSWKALLMFPPKGRGEWELYNLEADPGETEDLAKSEPAKLRGLLSAYEMYVQDAGVFDGYLAVQGRKRNPWGDKMLAP